VTIPTRPEVAAASRVVLKLGTRVLTHDDGSLALARLFAVVEAAARLIRSGREVLLVSSGAVGLGMDALGLKGTTELAERQACAAVGQTRLMQLYSDGFSRLGLQCGQVLLTQSDFDDRLRYLNLRSTLEALLQVSAVPIINENDAVATDELAFAGGPVFGDNDRLSALVASKLGADLLVLLTDVPGVFDKDPRTHDDAELVRCVGAGALDAVVGGSISGGGRGGMRSKVEAARIAARAGCQVVIASGRTPGALDQVLDGQDSGTWFQATGGEGLGARRRWIAWATAPKGVLHLDPGAVKALRERGASLLAAGVARIEGQFDDGDVVEFRDPAGELVGRGMVWCDADAARRWCAGERPDRARNHHALVHRNHLALYTEEQGS
jgi:glutamate 5-kinase